MFRKSVKFYLYLEQLNEPICTTRTFEDNELLEAKINEIDEAIANNGVIKFDAELFDDYSLRIAGKSVIYYKIESLKK